MKRFIPQPLIQAYHFLFPYLGALWYRFPSKKLFIVGITGTKGKSTTCELVRAILTEAGYRTALASTIHFSIGEKSERNLFKMTMPGRFFLQAFLRKAVDAGMTHAVIEMTSEGAKQFRHRAIEMNALIFTNLAPEHLESHGGMEKYVAAKFSIAEALAHSPKRPRTIVANGDDAYGEKFLSISVEERRPFYLYEAEPYSVDDRGVRFLWRGELFSVPLPGLFNLKNILAALTLGETLKVPQATMKKALEHIPQISGRAERVEKGQPFSVIVDYAHTPESLKALYETYHSHRIIGVLGATGGGRDSWKRKEMGKLASEACDIAILTNEDPYDEDPRHIMEEVASGFTKKKPRMVMSRRDAIAESLKEARPGDAVLITGKGTDPYIMGARGSKEAWSDRMVAEEELQKLGYT